MKIVLITGGFDPVHSGHISYIKSAKLLGDVLIVGINSDQWLTRKKSRPFMPWHERANIIKNLVGVDHVIEFDDSDNSARDAIVKVRQQYPDDEIIFANGGDRTDKTIPEMDHVDQKLNFVFSVGGNDKKNSSSWILEEWKSPKTPRPWGYYQVVSVPGPEVKIKELVVDPGRELSMQRHQYRSELWFVAEGVATVKTQTGRQNIPEQTFITIGKEQWHQLINDTDRPLKIIEIQYGTWCIEEDIERQ